MGALVVSIKKDLKKLSTKERAETNAWFFKTGKGEYGEGDKFIGVTVPNMRKVAKRYLSEATFSDIEMLLKEKIHEYRYVALLLLVEKYQKGKQDQKLQKKIVDFVLEPKNRSQINNWDLVDTSAPYILGDWFNERDKKKLYTLLKSKILWDRRIAIVSNWGFIKRNNLDNIFLMSEKLLDDKEDLIHKATGWMLREAGKKNVNKLRDFLKKHARKMPRTALRYAIEKFSKEERQYFMSLK